MRYVSSKRQENDRNSQGGGVLDQGLSRRVVLEISQILIPILKISNTF
jgi:hypothetical protein